MSFYSNPGKKVSGKKLPGQTVSGKEVSGKKVPWKKVPVKKISGKMVDGKTLLARPFPTVWCMWDCGVTTGKKFWITAAHHELPQQIFYVNIVTAKALVTAAKKYLLAFDLLW